MPKLLTIDREVASHEEVLVAMHCSPTKKGFHVYQAIDFFYQGKSIKEVAKLLHFTEHSVRKWIHKFNNEGVTGLAYRGKSGRPRKIGTR